MDRREGRAFQDGQESESCVRQSGEQNWTRIHWMNQFGFLHFLRWAQLVGHDQKEHHHQTQSSARDDTASHQRLALLPIAYRSKCGRMSHTTDNMLISCINVPTFLSTLNHVHLHVNYNVLYSALPSHSNSTMHAYMRTYCTSLLSLHLHVHIHIQYTKNTARSTTQRHTHTEN